MRQLFFPIFFLFLACPTAEAQHRVRAEELSVELPDWPGVAPEYDQGPLMAFGNVDIGFIYNVFRDKKAELAELGFSTDLDSLYDNMANSIQKSYSELDYTGKIREEVGGWPVIHELVKTLVNDRWYHFHLAMYESPTAFYSVVMTYDGDKHDRYKAFILTAIRSFRLD
jgi:hypothetical protein